MRQGRVDKCDAGIVSFVIFIIKFGCEFQALRTATYDGYVMFVSHELFARKNIGKLIRLLLT